MNSERGNREWLNDYLSLKQVNSSNPFTVPDGYFDGLEQQIVSFIKLDELKNDAAPLQGFTVPENYFDELSANINAGISIEETLDKEATGFAVPQGYFEELSDNINARINIEEALDKESTGFAVPQGYFEELSQQIQSRITVEESLSESDEAFAIPDGYFNKLIENILDKTVNQQESIKSEVVVKQKGIIRQLFTSSAFKYATAACLTLAVGATIFLSQNSTSVVDEHNSSFLHRSLSTIPVDEIKNYLQQNVDATDTRTLIDESKQVNAGNLSNDLQDELDTSQ
ncbi:hypothetical protein ACPPVU_19970 [Mucilaginibacter sp. McL0603]|uniref:hypothetical protein n=1 Tax=Mucilaginibacter sp. McL0603 TaxID=3415670 RepID=UPI003CEBEB85